MDCDARPFRQTLSGRPGYDPGFLGAPIPLPAPRSDARVLRLPGGGTELRYATYSVLMHGERRLALVSAGNVDPSRRRDTRRRNDFRDDPRLDPGDQAGNAHYRDNPLDRGHLFRRADAAWGDSIAAAQRADDDTFFWTNIAPQHEVFNQPGRDAEASLWGDIERHLVAQAGGRRWTVMNGPVFRDDDPMLYGLAVPQAYYKVVAVADGVGGIAAHAFVLGQEDLLRRLFRPGRFGVFQVTMAALEAQVALDFGDALHAADRMAAVPQGVVAGPRYRRIETLVDLDP